MVQRIEYAFGYKFPGTRLTYLAEGLTKYSKRHCIVQCDCGTVKEMAVGKISTKASLSCGCYLRDLTKARYVGYKTECHWLYNRWYTILRRCTDSSFRYYQYYGAKGIVVAPEWYIFEVFCCWVENVERMCKTFAFDIHRISKSKIYSSETCICLSPEEHRIAERLGV